MFKKIFKFAIPILLISIILLIAYNSYIRTQDNTQSPITVIPTNASIVLQVNDVNNLSRSIKLATISDRLKNIKQIESIIVEADKISNFFTKYQDFFIQNSLYISLHQVSQHKSAVLYSTIFQRENIKQNKDVIALFSNDFITSEYDNQTIYFSKRLNRYFSLKDNILFYSNNKMLLTDAIRTSNENTDNLFVNPSFLNCYKTISNSANINLMINYNNLFALSNIFTNISSDITHLSEWTATDLKLKDNAILSSGISTLNNTIDNFTDIFKGQSAQNLNVLNIIPQNTTQLFAISFDNPKEIYERKNKILQKKNRFWSWDKKRKLIEDSSNISYTDFIYEADNEAGIFNTSASLSVENTYTYFNTKESIRATSLIQGMILSTYNYKDYSINEIKDRKLTANLFGELFKIDNPFFTTIDDYFIFGKSSVSLEYIIDNYKSKNVLSNNKSFKNLDYYISNKANIFLYLNPSKTAETFKNRLINRESFSYNADSISKFTALTLQINTTKNGMLHNLCLFHDDKYKESIKEEWYFPLDTISAIHPQFVNNHFTNDKMILVQDHFNNLIALNSSGKKIWNKKIEGKILGEINHLDAYKNNKFQALFNTKNQLYLIDRNGNDVDGYPIKLPTTTSIGHSLFDYDKNKEYRILIVGNNNNIYNLNKKGKKIEGWKYLKTSNRVNKSPIHFIVNGKDFILNATSNTTTKLLARNGSDRVLFKDIQSFTSFVKISKSGELYAIANENKLWVGNVNGSSEIIELPYLNDSTKILAYNNGYYITHKNSILYLSNNESQEIELDSPANSLELINEYVAITTNNYLYLFKDYQAIEGFPIDSDGYFNISDIDKNGKINIVNIKNGFVYNYELTN